VASPFRRLRLTLCHEIGHLPFCGLRGIQMRHEERWCNAFSAELFMPKGEIVAHYAGSSPSAAIVQEPFR
jgi:Zn-dependent peptidase ImmA (M78 family)